MLVMTSTVPAPAFSHPGNCTEIAIARCWGDRSLSASRAIISDQVRSVKSFERTPGRARVGCFFSGAAAYRVLDASEPPAVCSHSCNTVLYSFKAFLTRSFFFTCESILLFQALGMPRVSMVQHQIARSRLLIRPPALVSCTITAWYPKSSAAVFSNPVVNSLKHVNWLTSRSQMGLLHTMRRRQNQSRSLYSATALLVVAASPSLLWLSPGSLHRKARFRILLLPQTYPPPECPGNGS